MYHRENDSFAEKLLLPLEAFENVNENERRINADGCKHEHMQPTIKCHSVLKN